MYKKMNAITDSLDQELEKAHAIDKNKKVINKTDFKQILNKKIKELNALEPLVANEMGVVTDREAAADLFHRIGELQRMLDNYSLDPERDNAEYKIARSQQKINETPSFLRGISKLISKILPKQDRNKTR